MCKIHGCIANPRVLGMKILLGNQIRTLSIKRFDQSIVIDGCRLINHSLFKKHPRHLEPCMRESSSFSGAPIKEDQSELSAVQYEDVSDVTLDSLTEAFENFAEDASDGEDYDIEFSSGVLTIKLGSQRGTYVINKQSPNKQIWLSSPKSGPKRYDFKQGVWVYKYETETMHELLSREIEMVTGERVEFSQCEYGKRDSG